jgi:hypothetical protein
VAVYAPLAAAPVPPDVVLVRGNARQVMLLAGAAGTGPTAIPACNSAPSRRSGR